jgi:hypothetical protein
MNDLCADGINEQLDQSKTMVTSWCLWSTCVQVQEMCIEVNAIASEVAVAAF